MVIVGREQSSINDPVGGYHALFQISINIFKILFHVMIDEQNEMVVICVQCVVC